MKISTNGMGRYTYLFFPVLLLALGLLNGCSGLRPYPNTLTKNLHIRTETDSGSIFSSVRAEVDIFNVMADCKTEYQGTVKLKGPSIKVGIPSDRLSYLSFVFTNSSFLSNTRGSISQETLLKARIGYNYDIKVSYVDDIYSVAIEEKHPRRSKSREVELKDLSACDSL